MASRRVTVSPRRPDPEPNSGRSFSDMFFGFPDEDHDHHGSAFALLPDDHHRRTYESSENDDHDRDELEAGQDDQHEERDNAFWENQHQLLQGTLRRTSSLETGIRNAVKQVVQELQVDSGRVCGCGKPVMSGCRECLIREVSGQVGKAGYNSAVCKTKWRSSPHIPSGEHTFVDVVETHSNPERGQVRVIIEVNFRAEFEVARASEKYNTLLRQLPEVFVGKVERLQAVIKIMCSASKKCMRDKRMHMGPWRKQAYMHAKWLGPCHRAPSPGPAFPAEPTPRPTARTKPAASMLTVDLLAEAVMPNGNMLCKAVAVV